MNQALESHDIKYLPSRSRLQAEASQHSAKQYRIKQLLSIPQHAKRLLEIVELPISRNKAACSHLEKVMRSGAATGLSDAEIYAKLREVLSPKLIDYTKAVSIEHQDKLNLPVPRYLDFGCNNGHKTVAIAEQLGLSKSDVFGIDVRSYNNQKLDDDHFIVSTEANLPFESNSFGLITSFMVLHHVGTEKDVVYKVLELYRILAPNGLLLLKEHDVTESWLGDALDIQHDFYDFIWDKEAAANAPVDRMSESNTYLSARDMDAIVKGAGFIEAPGLELKPYSNPAAKYSKFYLKPSREILHNTDVGESTWEHQHLPADARCTGYFKLFREVAPDIPRMVYEPLRRTGLLPETVHWGQKKLLFSEIDMLIMYYKMIRQNPLAVDADAKIATFVYAGAASGTHLIELARLFPAVEFHLYDKNPFNPKLSNWPQKFHIYQQYFLDEDAEHWKATKYPDRHILFVSDIRTSDYRTMKMREVEDRVNTDQDWQATWYRIINPFFTMFKFRLPWDDEHKKYPKGREMLQLYPGQTSTETRLIILPDAPDVLYDNRKNEQQLAFYNRILRERNYHNPLDHLSLDQRRASTKHYNRSKKLLLTPSISNDAIIPDEPVAWMSMDDKYDAAAEACMLESYLILAGLNHSSDEIWKLHCWIDTSLGGIAPPEKYVNE